MRVCVKHREREGMCVCDREKHTKRECVQICVCIPAILYADTCVRANTDVRVSACVRVCMWQPSVYACHPRAAIPDLGEQESAGKWGLKLPSAQRKHSGEGKEVCFVLEKKTATHFCIPPQEDRDEPYPHDRVQERN